MHQAKVVNQDQMINVKSQSWSLTPDGEPRGYIQPKRLEELWFHTGTRCNLSCDFCLEGSSPSDKRLQSPKLEELIPFIDEAIGLGTKQFSFTGGEPMLVKDIVSILKYASKFGSCLVLTNGTAPLMKRMKALMRIRDLAYPISFRISLDHPDHKIHDSGRGEGEFQRAIDGMKALYDAGFSISVARHMKPNENIDEIQASFEKVFIDNGLPKDLNIVAFPDFLPPGSLPNVPHISEHCMTTYQTEEQRDNFMCSNSKMIVKKDGQMRVYACTLVDDDGEYDLGASLTQSMQQRISMKHHRCYSCFAFGASCSEM